MSDRRVQELTTWAQREAARLSPGADTTSPLQAVSGDASFRRYFRLTAPTTSWIAVDAPPANEDSRPFVHIARLLRDAGVSAPDVLAADYDQGFMLLTDFGDVLYLGQLLQAQAAADMTLPDRLYSEAITALIAIQTRVDKETFDPYDAVRLTQEMALFEQWFCGAFLQLTLSAPERELVTATFTFLTEAALSQPQVVVHRDYHSRNLLVLDEQRFGSGASPGIIDFQDAVVGAYTYDLVSLLRDCYIYWEVPELERWAARYHAEAQASGVIAGIDADRFRRDLDLMGLQRHLKVLGIFARLSIRDQKSQYLADIPLVIRYLLDVSQHYPEMASFLHWFTETVLPVARVKLNLEIQCER